MNRKRLRNILLMTGIIVLLGIAYFGVYTSNKISDAYAEPSPEPTNTVTTENWKDYRNDDFGIKFSYPADVTFEAHSNPNFIAILRLKGPTDKSPKVFDDGINLVLMSDTVTINSLKEAAETRVSWSEKNGEIIKPLQEVTIGNNTGFRYQSSTKTNDGEFVIDQIYFLLKDNRLLSVENLTVDPTNQGYQKIVDQILSTLVISE